MNRLEIVDDFDEVKSIARQIDEGIRSLDQKLSSCSRFGLSLKPEETRMKAENLLKNMSEEIDCMKVTYRNFWYKFSNKISLLYFYLF